MTAGPIDNRRLPHVLRRVRAHVADADVPVVTLISQEDGDPFRILVSTLLSARTKDEVTAAASRRLFAQAPTPEAVLALTEARVAELIYPVGFYKTKARNVLAACRELVERFGGEVPRTIDELVTLPGVGRKTANLVLVEAFAEPAICVDTHVHRITNLWGYVDTASPHETEMALRAKLPRRYWLEINRLLVSFGQHTCVPASPLCSRCPLDDWCPRLGVKRHR
ncbi:MAG: endonuclease III [Thermoanaerobaculia bacterium]|nr:endonuclease III [Thermoanaerobaculia bacterium]